MSKSSKFSEIPIATMQRLGQLGVVQPHQRPMVVQVRPKGVGPWAWPHSIGPGTGREVAGFPVEFEWATVNAEVPPRRSRNGVRVVGHSIGHDRQLAVPWDRVEEVIDAWFDAHDDEAWPWEFRLVTA